MKKSLAVLFAASLLAAPSAAFADHHEEAGAETQAAALSTDTTPIGELIGNPDTKAILDTHMPGLADNPQLAMASSMTLRQIAGFSGGAISDEKLDAIDADLAKLSAS